MGKNGHLRAVVAILVMCMAISGLPHGPAYAKTTKEKLEDLQNQHTDTSNKLKETNDNLNKLNNEKGSLQAELDNLNDQLTLISDQLAQLEEMIRDKEDEIEQARKDLEEAERLRDSQYESMKKRIQFMYERRKTLLSDVLFDTEGFSDVLNRKEYIVQIEQYDKEMMDEYSETCKRVEDNKAMLEADMNMLDTYQKEIKEKQENVSVYVDNTVKAISMYSGQIKEAERTADAYAKQSAAEEADIAALKRKLAEEIAMSKLASQSEWRTIGDVTFEEGDRYLLANLIYCEAGNQPYEGQLAVGAVVINRLLSSVYPNTVVGVIYQRKQFSPVLDGHLAIALAQDKATENCYKAADEAMSGKTNVGGCVYFRTPIEGLTGIQIGGHIFY